MTDFSFDDRSLKVNLVGSAGQTGTQTVFIGERGRPEHIRIGGIDQMQSECTDLGALETGSEPCWYYDGSDRLLYLKIELAPSVEVVVDWIPVKTPTPALTPTPTPTPTPTQITTPTPTPTPTTTPTPFAPIPLATLILFIIVTATVASVIIFTWRKLTSRPIKKPGA